VGFIKTLLIILFFYYGFKVLARLLAPFLMRYAAKKIQDKFKDQMGKNMRGSGFGQQDISKKEGEVHVRSKKSPHNKINSDSVGDYVDFEEIE
tara:strand:- start:3750 stop:4028 length:279 start_codon:yes stop_codon:yes gene_type:complete